MKGARNFYCPRAYWCKVGPKYIALGLLGVRVSFKILAMSFYADLRPLDSGIFKFCSHILALT